MADVKAALARLEARGGWNEADLNDFAIVESLLEQLEAALSVIDFTWEAMGEICEAMAEPPDEAASVADSAADAVHAKIEEFRASYPASRPS